MKESHWQSRGADPELPGDGTQLTELAEPGVADALADAKEALTAAKAASVAAA